MNATDLTPLYAVVGSEPVMRRAALAHITSRAGSVERVSAAACTPNDVTSPSLLASPDQPVVRVVSDYAKWSPAQRKRLAATALDPAPGIVVVVVADKLGAKDPLRGALAEHALVTCDPPAKGRADAWLRDHAKLTGVKITDRAVGLVAQRLGDDTEALASELGKLVGAAAGGEVTDQLAAALTPDDRQRAAWPWAGAVIDGDAATAMTELAGLSGQAALALTGALSSRLTMIAWLTLGCTDAQAGASPWAVREARRAITTGWDAPRTLAALEHVGACERGLRGSSRLPDQAQLARLTARVAGLAR